MLGILYIVATPIGNLEDLSDRAKRILKEVDLVIAEDTRVVKKLLSKFEVKTPVVSYHQHSREEKKNLILKRLVEEQSIALVSDAGTPGISDPGNELIDFISNKEPRIKIIPIPGPSALTAALSICGFNVNKFTFLGFLPKKKGRSKLFEQLKESKLPFVFFESPKRILKTLDDLVVAFGGNRRVFVGRELTKLYETTYRGTLAEVRDHLVKDILKGEITVVVESTK